MSDRSSRWQRVLDRGLRTVAWAALALSAATLVALTALITTEALLRSFADYSIDFVHELSGYGVVLLTVIGGAVSLREHGFFRVRFFFDRLAGVPRTVLTCVHVLLSLVFCVALLRYTVDLAVNSYQGGNASSTTLATPLYLPQIVLPIGCILLILFLAEFALNPERRNETDAQQDTESR